MVLIAFRRVEQVLWWVFLATLAFQARIIVWQADALFVEWRSASVYATDVLFIALLVVAAMRLIQRPRNTRVRVSPWDWALGSLMGVALLTVVGAEHRGVSLYGFLRLAQGAVLYGYVRWYALERFDRDLSLAAFVMGAMAQAALGLAQFVLQHHVGLHTIGETILYPRMRGVAVFYDLAGTKTLRAYGTMPHPNVLALQLIFALIAVMYLSLRHRAATLRQASLVWFVTLGVLLWGFLATFSRTVIAAATVAIAIPFGALLYEKTSQGWPNASVLRRGARNIFIVVLVSSLAFGVLFWSQVLARIGISPHEEAVQLRSFYNGVALSSGDGLFGVNWFGAGIGNFVTWLMRSSPHLPSWQYQPAHNLFLLVYTEMGVLGLSALSVFLALLIRALVRRRLKEPLLTWGLLSIAGLVLFVALFDHFFWTLQQGRLMWWLFWGVVAYHADHSAKVDSG